MNRFALTALAGSIAVGFAGTTYANDPKPDKGDVLVCYKVLEKKKYDFKDTYERLVLDIVKHSKLSQDGDYNKQVAYDVAGKFVTKCNRGWDSPTADGTLITSNGDDSSSYGIDKGARLGVDVSGVLRGCKNVTFDCTSKKDEVAPDTLRCRVRTEGSYTIRKVKLEAEFDGLCGVFRDREEEEDNY